MTNEETVQAATRVIVEAALRIIERDPHQWSDRPCASCAAVTELVGRPFGCSRRPLPRRGY